jgi:hypothetical protein
VKIYYIFEIDFAPTKRYVEYVGSMDTMIISLFH